MNQAHPGRMHDDELDIDEILVAGLLADQFPALAGAAIRRFPSTGTVNAVFRVGDHAYVRLPRAERWASDLDRELSWLPPIAGRVSLAVPTPIGRGRPSSAFPLPWALFEWIDGRPYADELVDDEAQAARDLARFVLQLRTLDPTGAPPAGRRPLAELDTQTRAEIARSAPEIDAVAALAAWDRALTAPAWTGPAVWIHGDLLRPNLLVHDGRLAAVIDFGAAGIGDPAMDVIAAWSVFGPSGRAAYRDALAVDAGTWNRARGVALHQAAVIIPYYRATNPAVTAWAVRTIEQIVMDVPLDRARLDGG